MAKHTLVGTGAPATTPTMLGEHYTDTSNGQAYLSVGTSSSADWIAVGGGVGIAAGIHAAAGKTTPVDADEIGIVDSAASNVLKKLTWANLKATLKTYLDTLYAKIGLVTGSGLTMATARLLGRTTASAGAVEEITVGTGLSLSAGALTATGPVASQTGEMISGYIGTASDKSYKIVVKAAHAGTATETTTVSDSGTCTATFKVNSTAFGGTANSVSSSEQSQAHASSNTWSAGDDIVITISGNSACLGMSFTIKYTRTLV